MRHDTERNELQCGPEIVALRVRAQEYQRSSGVKVIRQELQPEARPRTRATTGLDTQASLDERVWKLSKPKDKTDDRAARDWTVEYQNRAIRGVPLSGSGSNSVAECVRQRHRDKPSDHLVCSK